MLVAVLAGPLLGEWPGRHRYGAIGAGFVGVLIVTRPGLGAHWAVLVAVLTAVANALYAITTRRLAGRDKPRTTLFYSGLIGAVVVLPVLPAVWAAPPGRVWAAVVGMGVLATLGHYLMIQANERALGLRAGAVLLFAAGGRHRAGLAGVRATCRTAGRCSAWR